MNPKSLLLLKLKKLKVEREERREKREERREEKREERKGKRVLTTKKLILFDRGNRTGCCEKNDGNYTNKCSYSLCLCPKSCSFEVKKRGREEKRREKEMGKKIREEKKRKEREVLEEEKEKSKTKKIIV